MGQLNTTTGSFAFGNPKALPQGDGDTTCSGKGICKLSSVAGNDYNATFGADPNQTTTFTIEIGQAELNRLRVMTPPTLYNNLLTMSSPYTPDQNGLPCTIDPTVVSLIWGSLGFKSAIIPQTSMSWPIVKTMNGNILVDFKMSIPGILLGQ